MASGLCLRFRVGGYPGYSVRISALLTIRSFFKERTRYFHLPLDTDGMHFVLNLLLFFVVMTIALGLLETRRKSMVENKS